MFAFLSVNAALYRTIHTTLFIDPFFLCQRCENMANDPFFLCHPVYVLQEGRLHPIVKYIVQSGLVPVDLVPPRLESNGL